MKILILLLALPLYAPAETAIVNVTNQGQLSIPYKGNVQFCDGCTVVWDTGKDGPLPPEAAPIIGYAERFTTPGVCQDDVGRSTFPCDVPHLRANATMLLAYQAAQTAAVKAAADAAAAKAALLALKAKIKAKTATAADVRDAVGAVMDNLNIGN